jgi:pimeloyl-ACP methyl ester carboxylesterase
MIYIAKEHHIINAKISNIAPILNAKKTMSTFVFSYNNFSIEYKILGSGNEYMLAFHGMGRSADDFKIFEDSLGKRYTIVAINLFFHGNSKYPVNRIFHNQIRKDEFVALIEKLLSDLNINRFSLMGYSLGGRFVLSLVQFLDKRIDRIILIAPDGLKRSLYNDITTNTLIGKNFVKWMVKYPEAFFGTVDALHKYRLISNKVKKVIHIHFENHERRVLMRNALSSFKHINPNLRKVARNINKSTIELVMIFGKYDFIIPVKLGELFLKKIKANKKLHLINSSHNILTENASKALAELVQ